LHLKLPMYDRRQVDGLTLTRAEVDAVIDELLAIEHDERKANPCIGDDRADFLLAGCSILKAAYELIPTDDITVADRGVREGILLSLFQKYQAYAT